MATHLVIEIKFLHNGIKTYHPPDKTDQLTSSLHSTSPKSKPS